MGSRRSRAGVRAGGQIRFQCGAASLQAPSGVTHVPVLDCYVQVAVAVAVKVHVNDHVYVNAEERTRRA